MDHASEVPLIEQIFGHVESNSTDMAAATVRTPVSGYTDPARYAREVELLFRKTPMMVGYASRAARPGDDPGPTQGRYEHALGWFHETVNEALESAA